MNTRVLSRRTVLRGAGASIALPWLEIMSSPRSARAAVPKRFVGYFSANGMVNSSTGNTNEWTPSGSETSFSMSRILKPLEPHRAKVNVLVGVDNPLADAAGPGDQHMKGMATMLTGVQPQAGQAKGGGASQPAGLAGGISVDQEMVARLDPRTKFRSLEIGVQTMQRGTIWYYMSYGGPAQPLPAEDDPRRVFQRVFSDFNPGDDMAFKRLRAERKSVLDAAADSFTRLNKRLGSEDRTRLDGHLTVIRNLEMRLFTESAPAQPGACVTPAAPANVPDHLLDANMGAIGKLQSELLAMALACDLTRVATLQWSMSASSTVYGWLGARRGHHDMSHDSETNTATQEILTKIGVWHAERFAYFIKQLDSIPEGDGTVLDNTLVYWCNEIARGNHSHDEMPTVLAGSAGGRIRTGRLVRYSGRVPQQNLLVSCLNAMDVPATLFGDPKYCSGALSGLT